MFSHLKNKQQQQQLEPKKKKSFSLLTNKHVRSPSLTSITSTSDNNHNHNNRGWLESSAVQVTPSRSSEISYKPIISTLANLRKPIISDISQQDILGAVSDEDIFNLTEIATKLPEISCKQHHRNNTKHHKNPIKDNSITSQPSEDTIPSSEAKAIVNEFYEKQGLSITKRHGRSHTSHLAMTNYHQHENDTFRRHSIDTLIPKQDTSCDSDDGISDQHRLDFQLHLPKSESSNSRYDDASVKAMIENNNTNTPLIEQVTVTMFDYFSLPKEIKELLDIYEHKGKVERRKMTVKYKRKEQYQDDNSSSTSSSISSLQSSYFDKEDEYMDDEDDDDPHTVSYRNLIIGGHEKINYRENPTRDIAILTTTISDNIEFTKLIQLDTSTQGPLLDLHVSMFTDDFDIIHTEEEFSDILQNLEQKMRSIKSFKKESELFLKEQLQLLESFSVLEELSSSSSSLDSLSHKDNYERPVLIETSEDPFIQRREEIEMLMRSLKSELWEFKSSLQSTEDLVADVQLDMDDFRNRMETYIKDIPESHYSALKKLEVDIESILSKRAKSPWLDTGYALLSYLLTLFALIVWIIIYILKLFKKVVLFPRNLWRDYSDYLIERNNLVKKASVRSVSGHSLNEQQVTENIVMKPTSSLFKRKSTFSL